MSSIENDSVNVTEKRVRKSIQRLSEVYDKDFVAAKQKTVALPKGNGINLGEIERVKDAFQRSKIDKEVSKVIHSLCYKTPGQAGKRNTEIRKFNGFDKDDANETKKRISIAERTNLDHLKLICDLFNIPITGKPKKDIALILVDYLRSPIETGSTKFRTSALRPKTKKKASKSKVKITKEVKKSKVESNTADESNMDASSDEDEILPKKKVRKPKVKKVEPQENSVKKKASSKIIVEDIENSSDISELSSEKESISEEKEINITKKKVSKAKSEDKKAKKMNNNDSSSKNKLVDETNDMKEGMNEDEKMEVDRNEDEDGIVEEEKKVEEDDPLAKYDLSDENLTEKIVEILKDADLNTTTLNQVCDSVAAHFPGADLAAKRHHIKLLVKKVNSPMAID